MNVLRAFIIAVVIGLIAAAAWIFFLRDLIRTGYQPPGTSGPDVQSALPPDDGRFRWGVQIRPYALNRYTDALMDEQLDLVKELGASWVRLDWHNYNDAAWHQRIIDEANKRGIYVVMILEDVGVTSTDPAVTSKASARAKEIATALKGKVKYYQLLNEVSGSALKGPSQPGTDFTRDYDQTKYKELRDLVKGLGQGVESADASAKLLVSGQWTHTAIFEQLIKDGVSFDILGWNWFSDMGEDLNGPVIAETGQQKITLLDKLKGFGKELWVTELNYRPGASGQDEVKQADYLKKMTERIHGYQAFKGLFVFELLDQSEVASKGGKPEYYGIVEFAKDAQGDWIIGAKKQAFDAYKNVISKLSQ